MISEQIAWIPLYCDHIRYNGIAIAQWNNNNITFYYDYSACNQMEAACIALAKSAVVMPNECSCMDIYLIYDWYYEMHDRISGCYLILNMNSHVTENVIKDSRTSFNIDMVCFSNILNRRACFSIFASQIATIIICNHNSSYSGSFEQATANG